MASTPILPFAVWLSGTNQNSIPANDNALRAQILQGLVISDATAAQPGSPSDGDIYILPAAPTGAQWAGFDEDDLVIFMGGTWYAFAPVDGVVAHMDGDLVQWTTGGGWASVSGDGGGGSAAWGAITGTLSDQTDLQAELDLKQARSPSVQSVTSSGTVTPTFANDAVKITAQAASLTLANPTGTATDMLGMVIRIKDNGTARSISYGTQYRAIGVTLPTTTVISKTTYLAMVYNTEDTKWDVVAVGQEA